MWLVWLQAGLAALNAIMGIFHGSQAAANVASAAALKQQGIVK